MDTSQSQIVGQVLFRIAVDTGAAAHVQSGQLHILEGLLSLVLERIRAELERRTADVPVRATHDA